MMLVKKKKKKKKKKLGLAVSSKVSPAPLCTDCLWQHIIHLSLSLKQSFWYVAADTQLRLGALQLFPLRTYNLSSPPSHLTPTTSPLWVVWQHLLWHLLVNVMCSKVEVVGRGHELTVKKKHGGCAASITVQSWKVLGFLDVGVRSRCLFRCGKGREDWRNLVEAWKKTKSGQYIGTLYVSRGVLA